ncbi:hypothetical protein [Clostridium kluyveri]|uniref:Uncharacterized protein n=1 Tax=Clostridium kluyveri TaxID=1534 RepID=A0A1L5FBZ4_CLOKL|nr:hypothetical protein [Clostridium kluyveri]APM40529.1 hypothetical protein BS101_18255 [Clostridium kluyveri]
MNFEEFINKIKRAKQPEVITFNNKQKIIIHNYDILKNDLKYMDNSQLYRYELVRNAGFNHSLALEYALQKYRLLESCLNESNQAPFTY